MTKQFWTFRDVYNSNTFYHVYRDTSGHFYVSETREGFWRGITYKSRSVRWTKKQIVYLIMPNTYLYDSSMTEDETREYFKHPKGYLG